jgi:hypothetical protein
MVRTVLDFTLRSLRRRVRRSFDKVNFEKPDRRTSRCARFFKWLCSVAFDNGRKGGVKVGRFSSARIRAICRRVEMDKGLDGTMTPPGQQS